MEAPPRTREPALRAWPVETSSRHVWCGAWTQEKEMSGGGTEFLSTVISLTTLVSRDEEPLFVGADRNVELPSSP